MKRHPALNYLTADVKDQLLALSKVVPEEVLEPNSALWLSFVLHVGFEAGLRKKEIDEARPDWFDLEQRCVTVMPHPGTRNTRSIPMTEALFQFLLTYPMTGTWCAGPDSVNEKAFWRYNYRSAFSLFMRWASAKMNYDLCEVQSIIMRPTFATLLLEAKVPVALVAQWLGCPENFVKEHYRIRPKR